jgi:hypothetical protein
LEQKFFRKMADLTDDCTLLILVELYGVMTSTLNQDVKRNKERFPQDFVFHLTKRNKRRLPQIVITSRLNFFP